MHNWNFPPLFLRTWHAENLRKASLCPNDAQALKNPEEVLRCARVNGCAILLGCFDIEKCRNWWLLFFFKVKISKFYILVGVTIHLKTYVEFKNEFYDFQLRAYKEYTFIFCFQYVLKWFAPTLYLAPITLATCPSRAPMLVFPCHFKFLTYLTVSYNYIYGF